MPWDKACVKTFTTATTALFTFTTTMLDTVANYNTTILTLVDISNTGDCCDLQTDCGTTRLSSPIVLTSGMVMAQSTRVYWQSSDLSAFPSDYASSLAVLMKVPFGSSSTTSSSTTSPTSTPIPTNTSKPSPRLGPGAQAGIGVGVLLSVIILLYIWRRRKRQHQQRTEHPGMPEMEGGSKGLKRFVGGKWRAETHGTSDPVEAEAKSVSHETCHGLCRCLPQDVCPRFHFRFRVSTLSALFFVLTRI
jgi:hypothetical protein